MPYKLISLVFLLFFLIINKAYSENEFILPVKKPSIFKQIEKNIKLKTTNNLPQKKPILQSDASEQNIVKEKKEIKKKITEKKDTSKKEIVKIDGFFAGKMNSLSGKALLIINIDNKNTRLINL